MSFWNKHDATPVLFTAEPADVGTTFGGRFNSPVARAQAGTPPLTSRAPFNVEVGPTATVGDHTFSVGLFLRGK